MVTIVKGDKTKVVTKGAYEALFRSLGWSEDYTAIASESHHEDMSLPLIQGEEDEIEKPISEMSVKELQKYAHKHDISLSGASNKKEYIALIEESMR